MTAPAQPKPSSFVEDVIDTFISPAAMFARRANRSPWGIVVFVSVLMGALLVLNSGALQGVLDVEVARAMAEAQEKNPNLTGEQLEASRKAIEASMTYGPVVVMPFVLLIVGLIVWLVGRVFGAELGYGGALGVVGFAYLPKVIEMALVSVQALFLDVSALRGRYQLSWGVGRFLDPEGNQGLLNLLGRVDLFTLWVTLLIALGLIHAGKLEKSKGYLAAALVWVVGALPALWQLATGG